MALSHIEHDALAETMSLPPYRPVIALPVLSTKVLSIHARTHCPPVGTISTRLYTAGFSPPIRVFRTGLLFQAD